MGMTSLQGLSEWLLGMTTNYSRVGVSEWLSGMTRNHVGFARAGSYLQGLPEWLVGMTINYGGVGVPEWLSGMTRNHVGFARAGSNPATHDPHMNFFLFFPSFSVSRSYFFNRRDDPKLKPHSKFSSDFVLCGFVRPSTRFTLPTKHHLYRINTRRSCCSSG